jgi:molecular chaperone DnaK
MAKVIGIDLGTTNTAVAVLEKGRPRVIEDDKGYKVLPSCVSAKPDGDFIVGQAARNKILTDPDRTVYAIKRLIGRRYDSQQAQEAKRRMPFKIEPAPDGGCLVQMGEHMYTPIEVCSIILQVAKQIAETALGDTVDEAVITVPAYFNHQQRSATFEAAKLAGLKCERLLNEPTAAALAFGFKKTGERTLALYDLGGGTFDISVLRLSSGVYEILATRGDTYLGGEDFDFRIVDWLADQFQSEHGIDLRTDRTSLQRLKDASERAKCELSFTDKTTILIPRITPELNLERAFDRLTLEGLVEDLIGRTLQTVRKAVNDSGLQLADIDDVILVGGQTRMPRVREAISGLFGKEPSRGVHPEEVVAIGAAVHAHSLNDVEAKRPVLLDVTPFDLGIDIAGGLFQPIIARNSQIPASQTQMFSTTRDNQETVRVTVRQGENRIADENEFLGEFVMAGITLAPAMHSKVEISFRLDANGMLHVTGAEPETGEQKQITIRNYAEVARGEGRSEPSVHGDAVQDPVGRKPRAKSPPMIKSKKEKQAAAKAKPAPKPKTPPVAKPTSPDDVTPTEPNSFASDEPTTTGPTDSRDVSSGILGAILGRARRLGKGASIPEPPAKPTPVAAAVPAPTSFDGEPGIILDAVGPPMSDQDDAPMVAGPADDFPEEELSGVASIGLAGVGFAEEPMSMPAEPDPDDANTVTNPSWQRPLTTNPGARTPMADPIEPGDDSLAMPEDELAEEPMYSLPPAPGMFPPSASPSRDEPVFARAEGEGDLDLDDDWEDDTQRVKRTDTFVLPSDAGGLDDANAAAAAGGPADPGDGDYTPPRPRMPLEEYSEDRTPVEQLREMPEPDGKKKKRAKIKLSFRKAKAMVAEYRDNLKRGGCFVKTTKPLRVGREVKLELKAPGLEEPLGIPGVVTWSSIEATGGGHDTGMTVEYQLDERQRREIERVLDSLA